MVEESGSDHNWSRPLLTWPEVFRVSILIGAQLVVMLAMAGLAQVSGRSGPRTDSVWVVVLNGLVWGAVTLRAVFKWSTVRQYSRCAVTCDTVGIRLTGLKAIEFDADWSRFKGYALSRVPRRLTVIMTDGIEHSVPILSASQETVRMACDEMDRRIPVDGIRRGTGLLLLRMPKWATWFLLVAALPLLGMPLWALWLNGFAMTAGVVIELVTRSSGLLLPLLLIAPLIVAVGVTEAVSSSRERISDARAGMKTGPESRLFPRVSARVRNLRLLSSGVVVIALCLLVKPGVSFNPVWSAGVVAASAWALLFLRGELRAARSRVWVSPSSLVIRIGSRQWEWRHGTYSVRPSDGSPLSTADVCVESGGTVLRLQDRWSKGEWLSRAIEKANALSQG